VLCLCVRSVGGCTAPSDVPGLRHHDELSGQWPLAWSSYDNPLFTTATNTTLCTNVVSFVRILTLRCECNIFVTRVIKVSTVFCIT
jgi:hypothetical protein